MHMSMYLEKKSEVRRALKTRGGGVLGLMFAGYVPLASQSPHPILVYFLANYRPHLSHFFIVQFNKQLSDLFN